MGIKAVPIINIDIHYHKLQWLMFCECLLSNDVMFCVEQRHVYICYCAPELPGSLIST